MTREGIHSRSSEVLKNTPFFDKSCALSTGKQSMRFTRFFVLLASVITHAAHADDKRSATAKAEALPLTIPFDGKKAKAAQEAWAKSIGKSKSIETNSTGMKLVLVPPGKFRMGRPPAAPGEMPQVDVTLSKAFYLGMTEVTQAQWKAVMKTTPWKGERDAREGEKYPATFVTWEDAQAFCKKLSEAEKGTYRLPTEAEWEFACRAGTTTPFSFGDDESKLSDYAWWGAIVGDGSANGERYAHEVGRKKPNPFGLYDMHGNVFELCEDVSVETLPGGSDPLVSEGSPLRVARGGHWAGGAMACSSWYRGVNGPRLGGFLGFRVVQNITE
jgi:formylglycine-generating enzyme required for sulfatase activity